MNGDDLDRARVALFDADRRWAIAHRATPLASDRFAALCRAQAAVMREQHTEYANVRAMLRKLVTAVTGRWDDDLPEVGQAMEALRQLRRVEQFLRSLQSDQEVA
jgi:hypothetical protein